MNLNDENLDIVRISKLLGVVISDNLKWEENTTSLVKRANARMELLRKVASFTTNREEEKRIYTYFILEAYWNHVKYGIAASLLKIVKI